MSHSRTLYEAAAIRMGLALIRLELLSIKAGFNPNQLRDRFGLWARPGAAGGMPGRTIVTRRATTGDPKIDAKNDQLVDIIREVVEGVPPGAGPEYGTMIHASAAQRIRDYDLPGIGKHGVEQSFSLGDTVRYGLDGSIRTDIVMRNGRTANAPIMAIWDIKTGGAKLTKDRVDQIRREAGVGDDVPVIEIHVERGIDVKGYLSSAGQVDFIIHRP